MPGWSPTAAFPYKSGGSRISGARRLARVALGPHEIFATVPAGMPIDGEQAGLTIRPDRLFVYANDELVARRSSLMEKPYNNRAWLMVAPVFALRAVFRAAADDDGGQLFGAGFAGQNQFFWNGDGWFRDLLNPSTEIGARFADALLRNLDLLAGCVCRSKFRSALPSRFACRERLGDRASAGDYRPADADPMECGRHDLANLFARGHRPVRRRLDRLGPALQRHAGAHSAWCTIVVIDVWHWTPLVILLVYAGLRAIPDAYYQAARIDGASRWAMFVNIELPKLQKVLVIAVLLRFMETFMIYTEPFVVTGGGPGSATTFLSIDLVKIALGQVDLGSAAAMSLVYNLITLTLCWIFFTIMTQLDRRRYA